MNKTYCALCSILLITVAILLGLSLAGYSPSDSLMGNYYPAQSLDNISNPCGYFGAWISEHLFYFVGWGAYILLASLVAYAWLTISRQAIDHHIIRSFGWWMGLIGTLICLALLFNDSTFSSLPYGPGGLVGYQAKQFLYNQLSFAGTLIVGVSLVLFGGIMCAENLMYSTFNLLILYPAQKMYRLWIADGRETVSVAPQADSADACITEPEITREMPAPPVQVATRNPQRASQPQPVSANMDKGDNKGWFWNRFLPKSKTPPSEIQLPEPDRQLSLVSSDEIDEELVEALVGSPEVVKAPYQLPPIDLLKPPVVFNQEAYEEEIQNTSSLLQTTMADYGVNVQVVDHQTGPILTMYEIKPERGTRLNKISCLTDDLSIAMKTGGGVRIVAPLPGKNTIGIEIPNKNKKSVRFREVLEESMEQTTGMNIPIYLGCDVAGAPIYADLAKLPHLLIAGQTGSGKSVCLHSIIASILMTRSPSQVRLLMIDPKMVELSQYKSIPHLMHPVVTDMKKAEALLAWAVDKMEERYNLLAQAGVRHISQYNNLTQEERLARIKPQTEEERQKIPENMPFIVIIADEMADMMMTCPKEVESHIIRLAQKSRAVGIHLILATQKPIKQVVTSLIKSNLPARISFKVTSNIDSRVVLEMIGAEKLMGSGDMLFVRNGPASLIRGQGAFLDDEEIERLVRYVGKEDQEFEQDLVQYTENAAQESAPGGAPGEDMSSKDELYDAAVEIVINEGRGSISLLQTRMSIGYGRSARLIEMMTNDGILSAHNGGKPREVLISPEEWEIRKHQKQAAKQAPTATARLTALLRPPVTDAPNMYASSTTAIVQPVESYSTQNVPFEPDGAEEEYDCEEEYDEESPFFEDEELDEDEKLNEDGSNYNELEARLLDKISKAAQGYVDKNSKSGQGISRS
ncbi:MAG: DNA translocase FtsK [Thermoguttaceae bacterium]|nr:DNA translocase FtsK [Thermoguttaceae bacterium]